MDWRRLAVFIAINVIVSAAVTLFILSLWESGRTAPAEALISPTAPAVVPATPESNPTPSAGSVTATALPSLTPTSTPGGPIVYVVKSGDTLGDLAVRFDVPLADILEANNLSEDALLSLGQEIIIPVAGATPATPTPQTTVSTPSGPPLLTIFEIKSPGVLEEEVVVLVNLGEAVNLTQWSLSDGKGNRYGFPDVTIFADGEINVHSAAGTNTPSDLYWGQREARWGEAGTVAYLRDATGKLVATYRVP
jgi:LysM repeat protein